jgi:hypothetical protein
MYHFFLDKKMNKVKTLCRISCYLVKKSVIRLFYGTCKKEHSVFGADSSLFLR